MQNFQRPLGLIMMTLLASGCMQNKAPASKPVELFNGINLSDWTWVSSDGKTKMEDVWSVRNGLLHCVGTPAGYIRTNKNYTNFALHIEWRFIKEGNGGVLIRKTGVDKVWPKSIECQLLTNNAGDIWNIDEFPMKVDPKRTQGRRTEKMHPSNEKPLGQWNQYDIVMDGGNLSLTVNGELQNTATDVQVIPGAILLQSEGGEMEYRDFTITPFPGNEQAETPKDLMKGWHPIGAGKWTVEDGAIVGRSSKAAKDYGHLVSDAIYQDFKATFKFKCLAGNSGFYFRCQPKGLSVNGMQAEIDARKDIGGIYESGGKGWIAGPPTAAELAKFYKQDEWNDMTVEAKGDHVTVQVNGYKTADIMKAPTAGPFALQLHAGIDDEVMFKDLVIEGEPVAGTGGQK